MATDKATFLTVRAGNAKTGMTKTGKPYINIGLVVKAGPRKGEWVNYFKTVTEKTKPYIKKDLATMGVTDVENFTCDGRLFTAVWAYDEFWKDERVKSVIPSKFQPDITRDDIGGPNKGDDSDIF